MVGRTRRIRNLFEFQSLAQIVRVCFAGAAIRYTLYARGVHVTLMACKHFALLFFGYCCCIFNAATFIISAAVRRDSKYLLYLCTFALCLSPFAVLNVDLCAHSTCCCCCRRCAISSSFKSLNY